MVYRVFNVKQAQPTKSMGKGSFLKVLFRVLLMLALLIPISLQIRPAYAQTGSAGLDGTPDISAFPDIQFYLDVYDAQGNFVDDLQVGDLQIIEDERAIASSSVEKVENGLQVIVALNPSPEMAAVSNGSTGYAKIQAMLQDWAAGLPSQSLDDFSLSTPIGMYLIRERDPQKFVQALADYQPDLQKSQPSLNSLVEALDLSTDPAGRPLVKRAILFITPPLPSSMIASLPDLAIRANEIGVRVSVWMIGKATNLSETALDPLQGFAESTGGKYYQTASSDILPPVEPAFSGLRHIYKVTYPSEIRSGSSHVLQVKVNAGETSLTTDATRFTLEIEPPNPIFLSPPAQIQRVWAASAEDPKTQVLSPQEVNLQIMVEFQDERTRALQDTRLYIDGQLIAENSQPPFDRFTWPLSGINTSTQKTMRVEVVDEFGLSGSSMDVPIEIIVGPPQQNKLIDRITDSGIIAIGGVTISGMVLILILVFTSARIRHRLGRKRLKKNHLTDPLARPVQTEPISSSHKWFPFFQKKNHVVGESAPIWPRVKSTDAPARLIVLDENEQPVTGGFIALSRQEITFGSDPRRATQVLSSNTVDGLHARLYRNPQEEFFLADNNSVAGTWINYAPVTSAGARLEHGDLIHIGKVMLRFELTDPSQASFVETKVVVLE